MNPVLLMPLYFCVALSGACYTLSILTREYSWVDRIWSLLPPIYVAWFAYQAHFAEPRLNLMLALVAAWGARLTFNFARKGGYRRGGEDYRWAALQKRMGPLKFQLLNATFVAPYQNLLLLLISLPAAVAFEHPSPLQAADFVLATLFALLLAGETVADQQQWNFQQEKHRRQASGEAGAGFLDRGLFRFSRHPNFFCELGMWWCVFGFAVIASGTWINLGLIGPVLLLLLFQGSTNFTEALSLEKYPTYADYQKRTSRLIPLPPRG